ncbi:phage tail protein [Stappia sp. 28M-7]|jgi:microcystin-dependent protein|uniref:phage tail protein n=1 Tax=Stappia sp. 28M-7 TaxID=2762596 RepID=UPI00163C7D06|nr:tail fiber protein [Stappia sp. 28M-7]MBC2857772.1 phage tail protein [Stappia sp. 28M-7]
MSDPFVAEIRIFAGNFAPKGWAYCDGQLMPISQNTALFSLLGTTYGGDGKSTFALPDLQGRSPMQHGQGPGLSFRHLGESSGSETVTLLQTEMPQHTHRVQAVARSQFTVGNTNAVEGNLLASPRTGNQYTAGPAGEMMAPQSVGVNGGSQPHNNMQPYLTLTFIIALQGIFPPRP